MTTLPLFVIVAPASTVSVLPSGTVSILPSGTVSVLPSGTVSVAPAGTTAPSGAFALPSTVPAVPLNTTLFSVLMPP